MNKPWWEQVTALVSLSVSGAVTGLAFVPNAPAELTSPSSMPIHLLALEQTARTAPASGQRLRPAIVNVASYFLRMAASRTPAQMEAIIWQHDSIDGVDHGESCAAFASLTLELASHAVGQQSWVTGGTSYPWPLHKWADVRVEANPASPGIISVLQDAEAHGRWHPLGDGYRPQPGDWVLFDGHVEVVTTYTGGVLDTIGGDSLPNYSVNAHQYPGPLSAQGVVGFVNNGELPGATGGGASTAGPVSGRPARTGGGGAHEPRTELDAAPRIPGARVGSRARRALTRAPGDAPIPGLPVPPRGDRPRPAMPGRDHAGAGRPARRISAAAGAASLAATSPAQRGSPAIPGLPGAAPAARTGDTSVSAPAGYRRHHRPASTATVHDTAAQQSFINDVAPGAIAAQRRYGVPASVTIAQAIDESGWGQSLLASQDHNLFGIKGTGPAGSQVLPTSEFENGQMVSTTSAFRVYHNIAESISDHGQLLATSGYYRAAMAQRHDPNAFAAALTGVYATDPQYGTKLISLMRHYDLYRYDTPGAQGHPGATRPRAAPSPSASPTHHAVAPSSRATSPAPQPTSPGVLPTSRGPQPTGPGPHATSPGPKATGPAPPSPAPDPPVSGPEAPVPAHGGHNGAPQPSARRANRGGVAIPGLPTEPATAGPPGRPPGGPAGVAPPPRRAAASAGQPEASRFSAEAPRPSPAVPATAAATPLAWQKQRIASGRAGASGQRYRHQIPSSVWATLIGTARAPLLRKEPLYTDVASQSGVRWELLAACDWMQCKARPGLSPVHGERLGTVNSDGTIYHTKSAALEQCAKDLAQLAYTVYRIDVTAPGALSIRDVANAFAAFRWGALLRVHHTSAMEFPYSVAGLTAQYTNMRWPSIDSPHAPDKPGGRFRMPFGALPIVLSLNYPATV